MWLGSQLHNKLGCHVTTDYDVSDIQVNGEQRAARLEASGHGLPGAGSPNKVPSEGNGRGTIMVRKAVTSSSEIQALLNKGLTRTEVAKVIGITTAGVSWHLRQAGVETTAERLRAALPWDVHMPVVKAAQFRAVKAHLEFWETQGDGMSRDKLVRLRAFYTQLTDFSMVVRYDPEIPPRPGQVYGGFEYVPREDADGDLILRIDDHTQVPDEDREKWVLPDRGSWP